MNTEHKVFKIVKLNQNIGGDNLIKAAFNVIVDKSRTKEQLEWTTFKNHEIKAIIENKGEKQVYAK